MNKFEIENAERAIKAFKTEAHESDEEVIIDLFADLMHYTEAKGLGLERIMFMAEIHFQHEK